MMKLNLNELIEWHKEQATECRRVDDKNQKAFHLEAVRVLDKSFTHFGVVELHQTIYSAGKSKKEANDILWRRAKEYLVSRDAPETQYMSEKELEEYFGGRVINLSTCQFI